MFGYKRFERYGSRYVSAFIKENAPFFYQKITDAYNKRCLKWLVDNFPVWKLFARYYIKIDIENSEL